MWALLAGSAVGLLASTMGRLYSSAFYALHDHHIPELLAAMRHHYEHREGAASSARLPPGSAAVRPK